MSRSPAFETMPFGVIGYQNFRGPFVAVDPRSGCVLGKYSPNDRDEIDAVFSDPPAAWSRAGRPPAIPRGCDVLVAFRSGVLVAMPEEAAVFWSTKMYLVPLCNSPTGCWCLACDENAAFAASGGCADFDAGDDEPTGVFAAGDSPDSGDAPVGDIGGVFSDLQSAYESMRQSACETVAWLDSFDADAVRPWHADMCEEFHSPPRPAPAADAAPVVAAPACWVCPDCGGARVIAEDRLYCPGCDVGAPLPRDVQSAIAEICAACPPATLSEMLPTFAGDLGRDDAVRSAARLMIAADAWQAAGRPAGYNVPFGSDASRQADAAPAAVEAAADAESAGRVLADFDRLNRRFTAEAAAVAAPAADAAPAVDAAPAGNLFDAVEFAPPLPSADCDCGGSRVFVDADPAGLFDAALFCPACSQSTAIDRNGPVAHFVRELRKFPADADLYGIHAGNADVVRLAASVVAAERELAVDAAPAVDPDAEYVDAAVAAIRGNAIDRQFAEAYLAAEAAPATFADAASAVFAALAPVVDAEDDPLPSADCPCGHGKLIPVADDDCGKLECWSCGMEYTLSPVVAALVAKFRGATGDGLRQLLDHGNSESVVLAASVVAAERECSGHPFAVAAVAAPAAIVCQFCGNASPDNFDSVCPACARGRAVSADLVAGRAANPFDAAEFAPPAPADLPAADAAAIHAGRRAVAAILADPMFAACAVACCALSGCSF